MNIQGFNPQAMINNLLDEVLQTNIGDFIGGDYLFTNPSVNIKETETSFSLELAAPGLEKTDFIITVDGNNLVVSAKKEHKNEEERDENYTRREFSYANFERRFPLPKHVNRDKIDAEYTSGILKITLPKIEDPSKESININIA